MKKVYKFLSILLVPAALLTYSFSGGSPGGKTGSTGDGGVTCTQCHAGTSQAQEGWITTNIPAEGYTPGETYMITATGTHVGVSKFGFELTVENSSGAKLGGLTITDAARTQFANGSDAVTHTQAGNAPSGDMIIWTMDWTAPATGSGAVMFQAAFNAANGDGTTSGDQIYTSSLSVEESVPAPAITSVDPTHAEQGWEGLVTIMGENTSWMDGVTSVTFHNSSNPLDIFTATNIQAKSDMEITCDVMVDLDQEIGTYDVKVDGVMLAEGFTVDIASSIGDDLLADRINAYPNPATNYVNVSTPEGAEIRVVDMLGHQLYSKQNTNSTERIDLSGLENGIYFVQVMHESDAATMRIMKK